MRAPFCWPLARDGEPRQLPQPSPRRRFRNSRRFVGTDGARNAPRGDEGCCGVFAEGRVLPHASLIPPANLPSTMHGCIIAFRNPRFPPSFSPIANGRGMREHLLGSGAAHRPVLGGRKQRHAVPTLPVLAQSPRTAEVTHLAGTLESKRRFARRFPEGALRSGTWVGCR